MNKETKTNKEPYVTPLSSPIRLNPLNLLNNLSLSGSFEDFEEGIGEDWGDSQI